MADTPEEESTGSDAELITRVRAGDRAAYGELYSRHSAAALTLARQFSRSAAEADDLVSESFARVLDALIAGGGPDSAFRAYLFTTLRNTAYDRSRRDQRLQFTDDVEAHDVPVEGDDPVLLQAENSLVGKAFSALPERWQAVLWYTQVDGLSPAETGVLLGMSANAVTSLAYRAREGLREAYLQAHLADTAAERCRSTVDRLGAWARGGLSKREQAQVDAHLSDCDRCRALAAELTEINSGIRGLIAPLLLGGAAVGYLATTSATPMALVSAGTLFTAHSAAAASGAGGTAAAMTAAGTGAGGGQAVGAVGGFWTRPWVLASGGVMAAAAAVVTAVVVMTSSGRVPSGAEPPLPVTPATTQSTGATGGPGSATAPPGQGVGTGQGGGTGAPPATSPPPTSSAPDSAATTSSATTPAGTSSSDPGDGAPTTSVAAPPPIILTTSGQSATTPAGTTPAGTTPASTTPQPTSSAAPTTSPTTQTPPSTTHPTTTTATTSPSTSTSTSTTSPSTTTTAPSPATLSVPRFTEDSVSATAGTSTSVSFTVQNSGQTDSDPQTATVSTPTGVALVGGSGAVDSTASALRRFSALLAPFAAAADPPTCSATSCSYVVPAHSTVTVTLDLSVAPEAADGVITVSTGGPGDASLPFAIAPGMTALHLSPGQNAWAAGTTVTAKLDGTLASPDVTDVGTVVLPLRNGDAWITSYPDTCAPTSGDPSTISCSGAVAAGAATFGTFGISLMPGLTGDLAIAATLPGNHPGLPLTSVPSTDNPTGAITVTPLAPGGTISLTGPFGGMLIGAETMACATPSTTRGDCQGGLSTVSVPQSSAIPDGATVVSATLTWAATAPAAGLDASALNTVQFHDGDRPARAVTGVSTIPDMAQQMYVRSADVTADVIGNGPFWVDGIAATTTTAGTTAMAGWSLAVIWYQPGASATVSYVNPGAYSLSSVAGTVTPLAAAGAAIRSMSVVIWAADPWAVKAITAGGSPVSLPATINGVRTIDDEQRATGFTLLDGIAAGATGEISLVNVNGPTQAPFHGPSTQDGLWVGPILVIRQPG